MRSKFSLFWIAVIWVALVRSVHAEDGVTKDSIFIGQTIGLTGTIAAPVKEMNEGAYAYFNMINRNGGIHGRKIKLRVLDDKFDPKLTFANAEKLIKKDRVFALFQSRGTPHTQNIVPLLAAHKVPLVGLGTGAAVFHSPINPWVFNIRAKYQDEVAKGVQHFNTTGIKSIGLLHVDDSFGKDGLDGFLKAMASHQLEPKLVAKFDRVNPDCEAAAAQIIAANPQALIIVSSSKNTVEVIKALRKQGSSSQIMTLSNNSSDSFIKELGAAGAGVIVSQITPPPSLISTQLQEEFKSAAFTRKGGMSYAAMEGYVNAKVLVEGLRRAGKNLTRQGFIDALESMRNVDLGGLEVSYSDTDHTGSKFVELTMIGSAGRFIR